ncbi:Panacea domain-containing protein [Alcanivorax sp. DP30]|uniref:Panacea domain-containing protein n=1 Tax=Alcanivorax sp. DP30 TaxID=2606217 RepID=UPI001926EA93|nr:type II toxin-antitoxin system antitoxin SocA domain-containing protein [Alcanivorax sp. DP30]
MDIEMSKLTEFDISAYILDKQGEMSAMKLQKLLYYSQAWSMVWDEITLFDADFEAWANGPVLPSIYEIHRGQFLVNKRMFPNGNAKKVKGDASDTVDQVLKVYGKKTAQWLSNLTHEETPWVNARGDLSPIARSNNVIDKGSMHEYYSGL